MAVSMLSLTSIRWIALPSIHWWSSAWRRDARTRFVCILPIWGILCVVTSSMAMAMILAIDFASMPMCSVSIIQ